MKHILALLLVLTLVIPALGASPAVTVSPDKPSAKHYDPAHLGHSHKCNGCGALYHQQGDMGPYSQGSNYCPRCGYANTVPAPQAPSYPPQYPAYGMTWTVGRDGVRIDYPASGWTWTEGRDGRRVVYPSSGWTWTENRDGRRVIYPSSGWTWTEGRDGFRTVYPSSGWTWTEGRDGRRVAYPSSGWSYSENSYGRATPYPYGYGYGGQDYTQFLVQALSQALDLQHDQEAFRDLLLRQMQIIEY